MTQAMIRYGVWIPGEGWLRDSHNSEPFGDYAKEVAESAARLVGSKSFVTPIDAFLVAIEKDILQRQAKRKKLPWLI